MILRPATFADEKLLLDWRNDPTVLAVLQDSTPLSEERHHRWLAMMLAGHDALLYIAEVDGIPVGQGRIERAWKAISKKMDACVIGYSIGKEYRGKFYGVRLVQELVRLGRESGYLLVTCRIKRGNRRSLHTAEDGGVDAVEFF